MVPRSSQSTLRASSLPTVCACEEKKRVVSRWISDQTLRHSNTRGNFNPGVEDGLDELACIFADYYQS
jgi:hypothetical protein